MTGSVYILYSESSNKYYIGSSINTSNRLTLHNQGRVISTRNKGPWRVAFEQAYRSIVVARRVEYKLKKLKSRKIIERIIEDGEIRLNP